MTRLPASGALSRLAAVVLLAVFFVAVAARCAFCINANVTFSADYVLFDIDKKIVYAENNCEMSYRLLTIQADSIRYDVKTNVLFADGNVLVTSLLAGPQKTVQASPNAVAAPSPYMVNPTDESDALLKSQVDSTESGDRKNYHGDHLRFDLENMTGSLAQTSDEFRKIYFIHESLDEVPELPQIGEGYLMNEEPEVNSNAVTAVRFRISPDGIYEAWRAKMWVKGNKVINLPYWTNSGKKFTPGRMRLRNVRYSSNSDWNIGTTMRYKEARDRQGFVDLNYKDGETSQPYTLNLRQSLKFGKQLSGNVLMTSLFTGDTDYTLYMSRFSGPFRSSSLNMNYGADGNLSANYSGSSKWKKTRINGYMHTRNNSRQDISDISAIVNFNKDTKYIGPKRKLGYQISSHVKYDDTGYNRPVTSTFVAVSAFRSGINITKNSYMNFSATTGGGIGTDGSTRNNFDASARYSMRFTGTSMFSLGYNFSGNTINGKDSAGSNTSSQSLSMSYSLSQPTSFTTSLSTSYDLRRNKFGSVSSYLDYNVSKKCRLWTSTIFDFDRNNFTSKTLNVTYRIYGSNLSAQWYVEPNDFVLDVTTKFY